MFLKAEKRLYSVALSAIFSGLIIICAWITVPAPLPFTLQTFAIFLATGLLGFKGSVASVAVYILAGAVGLPVFSGFSAGTGVLSGPTGGYIIGFLFIPIVSHLVRRVFKGKYLTVSLVAGLVICYLCGSIWYAFWLGEGSYIASLTATVLPFILPDAVKLFIAVIIIRRIGRFVCR